MASSDSTAPRGLPGKLTISVVPRTPATARERSARGFFARPLSRIRSPIPGSSLLQTREVASGVTSRGPIPVPPVVRISSTRPLFVSLLNSDSIAGRRSATTCVETTSQPNAEHRSRTAGPEPSARSPRDTESLMVRMATRMAGYFSTASRLASSSSRIASISRPVVERVVVERSDAAALKSISNSPSAHAIA